MRNLIFAVLLPLLLSACGAPESVWAPDEQVQRATYSHDAPPSITLVTVISNKSGAGGHSALIINGSQRVIFDPAGSFKSAQIPERNDVIFGVTPRVLDYYLDYHARAEWHVVLQELPVSPEVAQAALVAVQKNGAVAKAHCAQSTTAILAQLQGFGSIGRTWFPRKVMEDFSRIPGVKTRKIYDNKSGKDGKTRR